MNNSYLPEGAEIKYVAVNNDYMKEALVIRDLGSTDMQFPTGAVVVFQGVIIGSGANQSALKNKKLINIHKEFLCIRRILKIPSGHKYWLCPGCSSHEEHAEARAVRDAIRNNPGKSIVGSSLYLYGHWWCCRPCWDRMTEVGISKVFLVEGAEDLFKRRV
ncbi:MAG: hypothetical protein WCK03_00040 [Candidatus Taylorbacteria bacterium]